MGNLHASERLWDCEVWLAARIGHDATGDKSRILDDDRLHQAHKYTTNAVMETRAALL
jgi:hypothetical protein